MNLDQSSHIPLGPSQVSALLEPEKNRGTIAVLQKHMREQIQKKNSMKLVLDRGATSEVRYDKISETGDLRTAIKSCLNALLINDGARAQILADGSFRVTDTLPPFLCEADEIVSRFERMLGDVGSADAIHDYMVEEGTWNEQLNDAYDRVKKKKHLEHQLGLGFSDLGAEQIIRGCAGEMLLQHMLQCMIVDENFDQDEQSIRMLRKGKSCTFPKTRDPKKQYSTKFTTKYNCELYKSNYIDPTGRHLKAEFDAALISGLQPSAEEFSRFYAFDSTLGVNALQEKMFHALNRIEDFITTMDDQGIQAHIFNVLFYEKRKQRAVEKYSRHATARSHAITLPLLDTVGGIAEKMLIDLEPRITELIRPRNGNGTHKRQSSYRTVRR